MKSSTWALTALGATLAVASPLLDKRALATEIQWFTVTVTVTGFPPAGTPMASDVADTPTETPWASAVQQAPAADITITQTNGRSGWGWGGWGKGSGSWSGSWNDGGSDGGAAPQPTSTPDDTQTPPDNTSTPPDNTFTPPADTPTPQQPTSTPPAAPGPTSVSSDYQQGILDSHNIHRANHSVSALAWSDSMASIAAQIAASCVYAHNTAAGGGGYGQNIGAGSPESEVPAMITNLMYNNEINFYPGYGGEPSMSNFEKWGHFSQIVWKSTTHVGCATQHCPNGLANTGGGVSPIFTVCNYSPPGNFGGQYGANVLAPLGEPTVTL